MDFCILHSAQNNLLSVNKIDIEIDISNGLHSFSIVGLGDKAVIEAGHRISSAIKNSGYTSPKKRNQKIVISLSPANIKKTGTNFDLGIALAYLKSVGEINFSSEGMMFLGELSLSGEIKKIEAILPLLIFAKKNNFREVLVPQENTVHSSLIKNLKIIPVKNLRQAIEHLSRKKIIEPLRNYYAEVKDGTLIDKNNMKENFDDFWLMIRGQQKGKRALEIVAAGGHNLALYGPPGTGKTILAKAIKSILPALSYEEMIECNSIFSISDKRDDLVFNPPFREPHHSSSNSAIIGGGNYVKPGEISLAHNGILLLDEAPEFDQKVINSLRQPLEENFISITRVNQKVTLPCKFSLIMTMNPCPCGYYKSNTRKCVCSASLVKKYQKKISGPIADRIEIWCEINNLDIHDLNPEKRNGKENLVLEEIKKRIIDSRNIQKQRNLNSSLNAYIRGQEIIKKNLIETDAINILELAFKKLKLSNRSYYNTLKVSRTIADLDKSLKINSDHVLEALQYRTKL